MSDNPELQLLPERFQDFAGRNVYKNSSTRRTADDNVLALHPTTVDRIIDHHNRERRRRRWAL